MDNQKRRRATRPFTKQEKMSQNRWGEATSVKGLVMACSQDANHVGYLTHIAAIRMGEVAETIAHGEVLDETHPVGVIFSALEEARALLEAAIAKADALLAAGKAEG